MHDERIEDHLRAALRLDADRLPLTITAAELERRFELRRRSRPFGPANLLVAAALGIALLGAAAAVGGWFDRSAPPSPAPSPSAPVAVVTSPSPSLSQSPTGSPGPLMTLDEMIKSVGPDRVVAAESFGRSDGTEDSVAAGDPVALDVGPIADTGGYRLLLACDPDPQAGFTLERTDGTGSQIAEDLACGTPLVTRDLDLERDGRIRIAARGPFAWRAVLEWRGPARARHAMTIVDPAPPADTVLGDGIGGGPETPSYEPVLTGGGIAELREIVAVPVRRSYTVLASCAGPTDIRYGISRTESPTVDDDWTVQADVPCDGGLHTFVLDMPLRGGGTLFVSAEARVRWHVVLVSDAPPVRVAENDAAWQMMVGIGPSLDLDGHTYSLSSAVNGKGRTIRVVVSCSGGSRVDIEVTSGAGLIKPVGTFAATCGGDPAGTVSKTFRLTSAGFIVTVTPDAPMWLALTVQEPVGPG